MDYQPIYPPQVFNSLRQASKKEAEACFEWFIQVKDERIKVLEKAVQTTPGFKSWRADYTPNSLSLLSKWFNSVVASRPMTPEEIKEEENKLLPQFKDIIQIDTKTLSSQTVSICFDVGIYVGECLKNKLSHLQWKLFEGRKYIDHNQPVLEDFNGAGFNPRRIGEVQAGKILKGIGKVDLLQIYNYWSASSN